MLGSPEPPRENRDPAPGFLRLAIFAVSTPDRLRLNRGKSQPLQADWLPPTEHFNHQPPDDQWPNHRGRHHYETDPADCHETDGHHKQNQHQQLAAEHDRRDGKRTYVGRSLGWSDARVNPIDVGRGVRVLIFS